MQRSHRGWLLILHALLDVTITGFYSGGLDWNTLMDYCTSPIDFIIACGIRQAVVVFAFQLRERREIQKLNDSSFWFYVIGIVIHGITMLKLLVLDHFGGLELHPEYCTCAFWGYVLSFSMPNAIWFLLVKEEENGGIERKGDEQKEDTTMDENDTTVTLNDVWSIFWSHAKPHWKWFLPAYAFMIMQQTLFNHEITLINGLADRMKAFSSHFVDNKIETLPSFTSLALYCSQILFVYGLRRCCTFRKLFNLECAKEMTSGDLRKRIHKTIVHQSISFFDTHPTGELVSRTDPGAISNKVPDHIEKFLKNVIVICGALPFLMRQSWQLTQITVLVFPIEVMMDFYQQKEMKKLSKKVVDASSEVSTIANESISTIRNVRSCGAERVECRKYAEKVDSLVALSIEKSTRSNLNGWFQHLVWLSDTTLVFFLGGFMIHNGRLTGDQFFFYYWYRHRLINALVEFHDLYTDITATIANSTKIVNLLRRVPELNLEDGYATPEIMGHIEFQDVHFAYPTRMSTNVLNGINLSLAPGKILALVGPSGNGKTTIVSLLQQLYAPTSGRILLDGMPIDQIEHYHFHRSVALVAQEPVLLSGSIRENIVYGFDTATEDEMLAAAEKANVHEFVSKLDMGYDTPCGEKGLKMSGGQKQRIAIARALIRKPKVLILDEATSALDAESECLVQEALESCSKDLSVMVIAHRLSTIRKADQIVVIEKGRVAEAGSHEELMKMDGMYQKLVERQLNMI